MIQRDDLEELAKQLCRKRGMEFVERVGEGTFKQTFHVKQANGQPIALKLYKASVSTQRDEREIVAMLKCTHPNIARLISVDTDVVGQTQLVTVSEEFLSGGTLASKGQISRAAYLDIGRQLIDAAAHIASLRLVHRDIKPDNIIFREDGTTPVITDFGVVRDLTDSSLTPSWVARGPGTPFFASPEQLNNEKALTDWRSDQFSLGVSLLFAAYGDHPYRIDGCSDAEVVGRVSSRQGPAQLFAERIKDEGLPVALKMISPWPVDRYRKPELLAAAWREQ